jgi:hypothetical protein
MISSAQFSGASLHYRIKLGIPRHRCDAVCPHCNDYTCCKIYTELMSLEEIHSQVFGNPCSRGDSAPATCRYPLSGGEPRRTHRRQDSSPFVPNDTSNALDDSSPVRQPALIKCGTMDAGVSFSRVRHHASNISLKNLLGQVGDSMNSRDVNKTLTKSFEYSFMKSQLSRVRQPQTRVQVGPAFMEEIDDRISKMNLNELLILIQNLS